MAVVWTSIGPSHLTGLSPVVAGGGRIDAIAVTPDHDGAGHPAMLLGMPGGGIWRSTDFTGAQPTWVPMTDHVTGLADSARANVNLVGTIAVDPSHPRTIYAGSGTSPTAVWKSTDGGATWALVGQNQLGGAGGCTRILVDPGGLVYATFIGGGLRISSNGGSTWSDATPSNLSGVEMHDAALAIDGSGTVTVHVGVIDRSGGGRSGMWAFTRGNWSMTPITATDLNGNSFATADLNHITMNADDTAGMVVSMSRKAKDQVDLLNVFRLINGVWQPQWKTNDPNQWFITQGGYVQGVAIAPDGRIYAGGNGMAMSAGGTAFAPIGADEHGNEIHTDLHAVLAYGGKIYACTDGGLARFTPHAARAGAALWEPLNTDSLRNFLSTSVSGHPTDTGVVLVGNQDHGIARSQAGAWAYSGFSNEREKLRFDPDPQHAGQYAYSADPNNGFYQSADGGKGFTGFGPPGVSAPDPTPPFAIHPKDTRRLLVAWMIGYETRDRGTKWSPVPGGECLAGAATYLGDTGAAAIAIDRLLYLRGDDDSDGNSTAWSRDSFNFGDAILAICGDPYNAGAIYVATAANVFQRKKAGAAWTKITGSLPLAIKVMTLMPQGGGLDPWLLIGTAAGVFIASKLDAHTAWVRLGSGFPDCEVQDLEVHVGARRLLAATWGRGAWSTTLEAVAPHVKITMRKDTCGVAAVEGADAHLDAGVFGLVDPLHYKWTVSKNVTIDGSDTDPDVKVTSPPAGQTATVTVTVTDADGATVTDTMTFSALSAPAAALIELVCSIRKFPQWHPDPLGDPPRDLVADPPTREEIAALHGIAERFAALSGAILHLGHGLGAGRG